MANLDNQEKSQFEKSVNARPSTPTEVSYRDGYVDGKVTESRHQRERDYLLSENRRVYAQDNAARGLLLGIILTSVVGIILGAVFFLQQRNEPIVPADNNPEVSEPPRQDTTIIERTIERTQEVVPVPQPEPIAVPEPKIEINVPEPETPSTNSEQETQNSPEETPANNTDSGEASQ